MNDTLRRAAVPMAAIAAVAIVGGWLASTSLQQDFAAYWVAGAASAAGLDPYVNHVGGLAAPALWDHVAVLAHSRFLYPPIVADLFRPFALLPYAAAKVAFTALAIVAWVAAAVLAARAAGGRRALSLALGAGALAYPLYLHLERGQIDLFVLVLLLVAFAPGARPWRAGAALAAAAAFKPALVAVLPVVAALGRWRTVAAALVGAALVALATVVVCGPRLAHEYATEVLPRAALYGEGGDEAMLLPDERLAPHEDELAAGVARVEGRVYRQAAWDGPASASVPRLLAPETPSRFAARAPALVFCGALVWAATLVRRRGRAVADEALILWAAAVCCVVASPAGWVMGLVWALPLVPWLARVKGAAERARPAFWLCAGAAVACAVPPPFAGWAALAGTALVAATVGLALARPGSPA